MVIEFPAPSFVKGTENCQLLIKVWSFWQPAWSWSYLGAHQESRITSLEQEVSLSLLSLRKFQGRIQELCGKWMRGVPQEACQETTRPHRPQLAFPLNECFLALIILNLSQRRNCLFSTQGNPIRANLASSVDHCSPGFSEGRCFGHRSGLKLRLGVRHREVGGRERRQL